MIVSHKHKFIYLKLYKVAGTSVEYFLEQFCGNEDIVTPIMPRESDTHKPRNYKEYELSAHSSLEELFQKIGSQNLRNYKIVANERNSWDRVASMYNMAVYTEKTTRTFSDWLPYHIENHLSLISPEVEGVTDWISYNCLQKDLENFLKSIQVNCEKINLLHAKNYKLKHYTEHYNSQTRKMVEVAYLRDIEYFGYEFGE
jgi:hypothetical protein